MNTWIFSKNGQVTEPLDLASAKKYVVENNDAYGWQASYTQWLPVNSINEFSALLPERKVGAQLPQKIVDEFSLACDSNTLMVFTSLYERDDRDPTSKGMTLYKISALAYYFSLFHYKLVKFTTFFSIANEHKVPMKRMGNPDDIAPSVSFLLSEDAKYITGQNIVVDGGWTCI